MAVRTLVDENTSPRVADELHSLGYDAAHVIEALDAGATDERIVTYARDRGFVVLTHDDDFLRPERRDGVPILYYSDDSLDCTEIVDLVHRVVEYVPDAEDLPSVTQLGVWE